MTITPCLEPGCDQIGVFPGERDDGAGGVVKGTYCFVHDTQDGAPNDDNLDDDARFMLDVGFHVDVTTGFAAMVLEHTAMTTLDVDDATGAAMQSMVRNTGLDADVCSGILLATTAIMAAGEVSADQLTTLAELYETAAETADDEPDTGGPDRPTEAMLVLNAGGVYVEGPTYVARPLTGGFHVACDDHGAVALVDEVELALDALDAHLAVHHSPEMLEVGPDDDRDAMSETCPACDGTGVGEYGEGNEPDTRCEVCGGRGSVDVTGPSETGATDGDDDKVSDTTAVPDGTESETR